jgi:hypothetical protein
MTTTRHRPRFMSDLAHCLSLTSPPMTGYQTDGSPTREDDQVEAHTPEGWSTVDRPQSADMATLGQHGVGAFRLFGDPDGGDPPLSSISNL